MNWLHFAYVLFGLYVIWFGYVLTKKQFNRALLLFGIAHVPYLLINLVAPFRGIMDPDYAGYSFGLWNLPQGPLVPLVVGTIVISCILIITKSWLNQMEKMWKLTFAVDLLLTITIAAPILIGILIDPDGARIQLGEFLTLSGYVVALIILLVFSGPTFYACYFSAKMALKK